MTELLREWFAGKIMVSDAVPPDEVWLVPAVVPLKPGEPAVFALEPGEDEEAFRARVLRHTGVIFDLSIAPPAPVHVSFSEPAARVGHSCTACGEVAARHCHACSTCEAAVGPCVAKP